MQRLWLKVVAVSVIAFVTAAVFTAYLKPGMLIEFANLVLCGSRTVAWSPPSGGRRFC
jgi:hypothetical protein